MRHREGSGAVGSVDEAEAIGISVLPAEERNIPEARVWQARIPSPPKLPVQMMLVMLVGKTTVMVMVLPVILVMR